GDVDGRDVLMVDDIISTGGSVSAAAQALKERGARDIYVAATHAVLCGPALERLTAAPVKELFVTDSIPLMKLGEPLAGRFQVVSVAPLLGEAIRRIHDDVSVSALFKMFA
ncbi:MAG TPA: ribose-phosphate diphosphokinase, partial [Candidatus Brocadiia bacterium]|nr:ribose-phosphate diphosphokinase [Candidatus Brocadiia bacterium]